MTARPGRGIVIHDGELSWRPAVDVTPIALRGHVVAVVALLTVRAVLKAWVKARTN